MNRKKGYHNKSFKQLTRSSLHRICINQISICNCNGIHHAKSNYATNVSLQTYFAVLSFTCAIYYQDTTPMNCIFKKPAINDSTTSKDGNTKIHGLKTEFLDGCATIFSHSPSIKSIRDDTVKDGTEGVTDSTCQIAQTDCS